MHIYPPKEIPPKKRNWFKWASISAGILLALSFTFLLTSVAHAVTTVNGLAEILETGIEALMATFEWLIETLRLIL